MRRPLLALAFVLSLAACAPLSPRPTADAAPSPALASLFAEYWEEYLRVEPLMATFIGDARYNDRLPNSLSAESRSQRLAFEQKWLERIRTVDVSRLGEQDQLSVAIFRRDREEAIESAQFPEHLQPLNQFYSFASTLAQLGSGSSAQPFASVQDYEHWLARMQQMPALFDQAIANMREGMQRGVVLPRALVDKVLPQLDALIVAEPTRSLFWQPVAKMPATFAAADRARLEAAYAQAIGDAVVPAYARLRDFIRDEYRPLARSTHGLDALPGGADWYAFNARTLTTTALTPAQIHQTGLDEVARIHRAMREVIARLGFQGDLQAFFKFLMSDPRFVFASEPALLEAYNGLRTRVEAGVPTLFAVTPRAGFEIRPVEAFRAQSAAGGSYLPPSEDGSRPGIFYVNTYDLPTRKSWEMEDLFLHEAIPGHHFQLAMQQELSAVPAFRRFGRFTAFVEGWALYAESLGSELGIYSDPYMYFGYLQNELWRAIRLVVDTGLHSKGWTREQVIAYMLANSAQSETQAVAEAERYMAIPGQALAYKIGELKIRELRTRAQAALGPAFDVRAFHHEVLRDGAVPLDVLETKIDRWIAAQRRD